MILVFHEGDREKALRRMYAFGVDFEALDSTTWDVAKEGIDLYGRAPTALDISVAGVHVAVRRNAVAVVVNPKLGEAVGYQPAAPQYLFPGYWGGVDVRFRTPEDAAAAYATLGQDWAVRLCLVPVGAGSRD